MSIRLFSDICFMDIVRIVAIDLCLLVYIVLAFIEKSAHVSMENGINEQGKYFSHVWHDRHVVQSGLRAYLVRRLGNQQITRFNHSSGSNLVSELQTSDSERVFEEEKEAKEVDLSVQLKLVTVKERSLTGAGILYDIIFFVGISFLLLHVYLCYKLYSMDRLLSISEDKCMYQCQKGSLAI
jgi:hypothetical protein